MQSDCVGVGARGDLVVEVYGLGGLVVVGGLRCCAVGAHALSAVALLSLVVGTSSLSPSHTTCPLCVPSSFVLTP